MSDNFIAQTSWLMFVRVGERIQRVAATNALILNTDEINHHLYIHFSMQEQV